MFQKVVLNPNLLHERIVAFYEGPTQLPRAPTKRLLSRWAHVGLKNAHTGETVTLEYCKVGIDPVTSIEAFQRFIERHNRESLGIPVPSNGSLRYTVRRSKDGTVTCYAWHKDREPANLPDQAASEDCLDLIPSSFFQAVKKGQVGTYPVEEPPQ